ncbi:methylthiotransferase [Gossypium arboreum]|uniref:Methylthiotransferase n=1 Tax=Gossypium arboreum TaxID=29729 RepID=A0A0B0MK03_GOSAR|nr:methylthiotransferase [Gossypium arboreum]
MMQLWSVGLGGLSYSPHGVEGWYGWSVAVGYRLGWACIHEYVYSVLFWNGPMGHIVI